MPDLKQPPGPGSLPIREKTVRFLQRYRSWNRGIEAGFPAAQADELVATGVAVQVHPPVEREPLQGRMVRK